MRSGPDPEFIKDLFGSISKTYDSANDVITVGLARAWRKSLVKMSEAKPGDRILDCATGTGDLALEFKKAVGPTGHVTGSDFCQGMLDLAPNKAKRMNLEVRFELGDVLNLEHLDGEFDVVSIAYGLRNVADTTRALTEMARVTRPGGHVMILETGEVENPVLRGAIRFYFENVVPRLGGFVSGKREAYEYLQRSSGAFPSGQALCDLMIATGRYSHVEYRPLMGGASFIYKGTVRGLS